MIVEGFEIENWKCIKRVAVASLPATGVAVLHGPNGTGKSSIIEALRACLMDYKSNSAAKSLTSAYPKNSSDKPRVQVTFSAGGSSWRVVKQFGSKESKLERRLSSGEWKLESVDISEVHDRTRQLCGGSDSTAGLHQLLWLTQAEFHLPKSDELDADVQSRLRAILGVLQTPLDDRFVGRIKERWSTWFERARSLVSSRSSRKRAHLPRPSTSSISCARNKEASTRSFKKTNERWSVLAAWRSRPKRSVASSPRRSS